jgi:hypothetical protein
MAATFLKTSQACQMAQSDACDAMRLECSNQLATTLKAQVGFDDGAYLRDMLMPYAGLTYPSTRTFQPSAFAVDTACTGDANQLMSASSRRSLQAARRQVLLDEYPRYTQWVSDQLKACKDRSTLDDSRRAQERTEAEKLAAAAAAAKITEEQRQKAEAEAKRKAEELQKENEKKQREAAEREEKERKEAMARAEEEKAASERRAKTESEQAQLKSRDEAERAKAAAERKAREAAAAAVVKSREDKKAALRTQKEQLTTQAADAEKRANEIAKMTFTAEQSQQAAQLNAERLQQVERAKTLRTQAAQIVIDDSDERSKLSLGGLLGVGVASWPGTATAALGLQLVGHTGFWGVAPAEGLASGFELRVLGRFLSTLGPSAVQQAEMIGTARYFFGRFGVGAAIEVRWNQPSAQMAITNVGFGPAVGVAFVDSPKIRVILNAAWLPLTQQGFQDATRATGDLEISYDFLTFNVAGGLQTQPLATASPVLAWYVGVFGGVRLRW